MCDLGCEGGGERKKKKKKTGKIANHEKAKKREKEKGIAIKRKKSPREKNREKWEHSVEQGDELKSPEVEVWT